VCGMVKLLYSGSYRTAAVNSAFSKFHFVAWILPTHERRGISWLSNC
jgi:hypothetical protein